MTRSADAWAKRFGFDPALIDEILDEEIALRREYRLERRRAGMAKAAEKRRLKIEARREARRQAIIARHEAEGIGVRPKRAPRPNLFKRKGVLGAREIVFAAMVPGRWHVARPISDAIGRSASSVLCQAANKGLVDRRACDRRPRRWGNRMLPGIGIGREYRLTARGLAVRDAVVDRIRRLRAGEILAR